MKDKNIIYYLSNILDKFVFSSLIVHNTQRTPNVIDVATFNTQLELFFLDKLILLNKSDVDISTLFVDLEISVDPYINNKVSTEPDYTMVEPFLEELVDYINFLEKKIEVRLPGINIIYKDISNLNYSITMTNNRPECTIIDFIVTTDIYDIYKIVNDVFKEFNIYSSLVDHFPADYSLELSITADKALMRVGGIFSLINLCEYIYNYFEYDIVIEKMNNGYYKLNSKGEYSVDVQRIYSDFLLIMSKEANGYLITHNMVLLYATNFLLRSTNWSIEINNTINTNTLVNTSANYIENVVCFFKQHINLQAKSFSDLTCIDILDRPRRFTLIYNLLSVSYHTRYLISIYTTEVHSIKSVTSILPAINWYERECWDLFGVHFTDHPDLRRILTDYGFYGHPLRKDFPLTGFVECYYNTNIKSIVYKTIQLPQEYRMFNTNTPWNFFIENTEHTYNI